MDREVPSFEETTLAPKLQSRALVIPAIDEGERHRGQLRRIHEAGLRVDVAVADGGSAEGALDPAFLREVSVRAVLVKNGPGG